MVPVPCNAETERWWVKSYNENPDRTLNILARLEELGHKWVSGFFDLLVEVVE